MNDSSLKIKTLALIAAITEEDRLIDYSIYPNAINTESFYAFITQLTDKLGGRDYALFLDNLSDHKTKIAKHLFEKFNITEIFNEPYCPQIQWN